MQNGISTGLIHTGGVVKDSPGVNPIDLIYQTNATPVEIDPGKPKIFTPINVNNAADAVATTPDVVPNITAVTEPATKNNTGIILAAVGLGGLLLFSTDGKKAVKGITGIGKKDKKGKSSILPLLLIGGAAAWYFLKDDTAVTTTTTDVPVYVPPTGGNDQVQQPGTTDVPVISAPVDVAVMVRNAVATNAQSYLYDAFPMYRSDFDKMTDAEIITAYQYLYGYVGQGLKLYRLPGATGIYADGGWNTTLYDAVAALKAKYNLNI